MNKLVQQIVNEVKLQIFKEQDLGEKNIIAIYPGRFQPMGRHHKAAFNRLVQQFGKENTYVVTNDTTEPQKSPLTFDEKKAIIERHGIKNVVKVNNPFRPIEFLKKFDPQKTTVIFMFDAEDRSQLLTLNRAMKYNKTTLLPFKDLDNPYVYYMFAPKISYDLAGFGEMSGETIRKALGDRTAKLAELKDRFMSAMGWFDPKLFNMVVAKMNTRRGKLKETSSNWKTEFLNMKKTQAKLFFEMIKKEYGDVKDILPVIHKFMHRQPISSEEKTKFMVDVRKLLKLIGLGSIAAIPIPGTMLLIPVIIKLARKNNIELPEKQIEETSNVALPIVRKEFWKNVFDESLKDDETISEKEQLDEVVYIPHDVINKLEDHVINIFERLADKIDSNTSLKEGFDEFAEYLDNQDTDPDFEAMRQIVLDWLSNEPYVIEYTEEFREPPVDFDGIYLNASGGFPYYKEIFNLLKYCSSEDCDGISEEISYLLDDNYESEYESNHTINYKNFKRELDEFKKFDDFGDQAQFQSAKLNDVVVARLFMDVKWIPLFVKISLIKGGVFETFGRNSEVFQLIRNYVRKDFLPTVAHELTHLSQTVRAFIKSKSLRKTTYSHLSTDDPDFWKVYLSDEREIGAHAVQFAEELRQNFPDLPTRDLLKFIQGDPLPKQKFSPYLGYYKTFKEKVIDNRDHPAYRKFLKLVYQQLTKKQ